MMYNNGLVVAIKDENGKVLREKREKSSMAVYLPFFSHYSIFLKNNNDRAAIAKIEIDGTNVLGKYEIIVDAKSSETVDRFCIDGDLKKGNKFYFVPKDDGRVADPTEGDIGVVKVTFVLEEEKKVINHHHYHTTYIPYEYDYYPYKKRPYTYPDITWTSNAMYNRTKARDNKVKNDNVLLDCSYTPTLSCSVNQALSMPTKGIRNKEEFGIPTEAEYGATVEGDSSNQTFKYGSIGKLEKTKTVIMIELRASKESLTVEDDRKKDNINVALKSLKDKIKELEGEIQRLESL